MQEHAYYLDYQVRVRVLDHVKVTPHTSVKKIIR